jgi:hypothetical protein
MRRLLLSAFAALLWCCADDKVAGGFDDVENPAIRVSLLDTAGKAYGAGTLRLYARFQNPGSDSIPVIESPATAGNAVIIRDTALVSAMSKAHSRGTPWPNADTVEFNLSAASPTDESFESGFFLIRNAEGKYRFLRRTGNAMVNADRNGVLETQPILSAPVLTQRGNVGDGGRQLGLKSVFVPGSPYWSKVEADGAFMFPRMAKGRYEMKAVSSDNKVYSAADTLSAGTYFIPSDWAEADLIWVEGGP